MTEIIICPSCGSNHIIKNGHIKTLKQGYKCKECNRSFVLNPDWRLINDSTKEIIRRGLVERLSLRGLARMTGVSITWLMNFIKKEYKNQGKDLLN